jgi:hypothetical protein
VGVERNEAKSRGQEFSKKGCETRSKDSKMEITLNESSPSSNPSGKERFFPGLGFISHKVQNLICCQQVGFLTFKGL